MNDRVWIIYYKKYENQKDGIVSLMSRDCENNNLNYQILFFEHFDYGEKEDVLLYKNEKIDLPCIALLRGRDYGLAEWLERHGVKVINNSFATKFCDIKSSFHNLIVKANIKNLKQPKYLLLQNQTYAEIAQTLGEPFVLKDNRGQKGDNVFLVNNENEFKTYRGEIKSDILCQEYISSSKGRDLRFYIIGDKVAGVLERNNSGGWKSNVAQGGEPRYYNATKQQKEIALEISKCLKAEIISVDFLFGENDGLFLCEANSNAAYYMFIKLGVEIGDMICKYLKNQIKKLENK